MKLTMYEARSPVSRAEWRTNEYQKMTTAKTIAKLISSTVDTKA